MRIQKSNGLGNDLAASKQKRHAVSTRIWHWVNAVMVIILLMSGFAIFNAHPRLYWGSYGADPDPAWFEITDADGAGLIRLGQMELTATGPLGMSTDSKGQPVARAFPAWATIPSGRSLSTSRRWHLSAAWVFGIGTAIFTLLSLLNGHVKRELLPSSSELGASHILHSIREHLRFRSHRHPIDAPYNVLQKVSYLLIAGLVIPTLILTGLTMSPWINAVVPGLLDLFGGRQSARSIHFICAVLMTLFILIHLIMILRTGPIRQVWAMITGGSIPQKGDENG